MVGDFSTEIPKSPNVLFISVITCSNKDQFSVKTAKQLFNHWNAYIGENPTLTIKPDVKVESFSVPIENGKSKAAFLKFCKEKYNRVSTVYTQIEFFGRTPESKLLSLDVIKKDGSYFLLSKEKY